MGEARIKKSQTQKFVAEHPWCCYCGGHTPATTRDHVPSRQMFSLRRRPQGLEVPACEPCNGATRREEQIAALMGRIYPDAGTAAERDEMQQIMTKVQQREPGLIRELRASARQRRGARRSRLADQGATGVLNASGPILNEAIQRFGVKLGLGLHYATTGNIAPQSAGIGVRWYSNHQHAQGDVPPNLLNMLQHSKTLEQGTWNAGDQFRYSWKVTGEGDRALYFSVFRYSFAVACFVFHDHTEVPELPGAIIWAPGFQIRHTVHDEGATKLTDEINTNLEPYEQVVREIGAWSGFVETTQNSPQYAQKRVQKIEEIYERFSEVLSLESGEKVDEAYAIESVKKRVREILGIEELTKIRKHLIEEAISALEDGI